LKLKIGNKASYLTVRELEEDELVMTTKDLGSGVYIDYDVNHDIIGIEFSGEIKPEYYEDYIEKEEV
jgi:uncharacterized protein YuzE